MRLQRLLLIVGCVGSLPLGAQSEPASIPTPLALALIGGAASNDPARVRLTVGTLPAGWPSSLVLPAPAWVLGGISDGRWLVAVFADSSGRPSEALDTLLRREGWVAPRAFERPGFVSGGNLNDIYCRDSAMVRPEAARGAGRTRLVRVSYAADRAARQLCGSDRTPRWTRTEEEILVLPPLSPPCGACARSSGSGHSSDGVEAHTELGDTTRTPAAIAAHYGAQLAAAGWTVSPAASNERVAALALDARDAKGKPWSGALTVVPRGRGRYVTLNMRPTEPR